MLCKDAIPSIHEYLDGDLDDPELLELDAHIRACPQCRRHLAELERSEALVKHSFSTVYAPDDLTDRIMHALPHVKKRLTWQRWVKRHPAFTAAALFAIVMFTSLLTVWNQGKELIVKGNDLSNVVIQGDTVYVPKGQMVKGNITVENGKIDVQGQVQGNVTVIDGKIVMASTAVISGQVDEINQAFSWLWFKMNEWMDHFK